MNRFRSLTLTAAIAALISAGVVYGQGPDGARGQRGRGAGGPGGRGAGLPLAELNLSEQQRDQFRALSAQYREQGRTAEERLNAARAAQRKAVELIPLNEGLIRSTTQELVEAQAEVAIRQAHLHAELFALLTPAQQEQAKKTQAEREARDARPRQGQRQNQR
jgi:protein CpxP